MVGSVPFNEAQRKENKQNKKISSVPAGNRGLPWNAQEQGGAKRERAGLAWHEDRLGAPVTASGQFVCFVCLE